MTPDSQVPVVRPRRRRRRFRFWSVAFVCVTLFMTLGASLSVGSFIAYMNSLSPIEELEDYDPPEATSIYDRTGGLAIGEFKDQNRQVVPLHEIPMMLRNAFVAIEDSRFYDHWGVDVIGVARAFVANYKAGTIRQGASTITMQLTRNILEDVTTERSYRRKFNEAIRAMQIERRYTKNQILEFYLNHIFFGYNAYGVSAAAAVYYAKELDELTIGECATLAGIIKAPSVENPRRNAQRALSRRDDVLARMFKLGMITAEQYEEAKAEEVQTRPGVGMTSRYPYFISALWHDLRAYYGLSAQGLRQGGLRVTSTLDPAIQDACRRALREGLIDVERKWRATNAARAREQKKDWNGLLRPGETRLMTITRIDREATTPTAHVRLGQYRGRVPIPEDPPFYEPDKVLKVGGRLDIRVGAMEGNDFAGEIGIQKPVQGSIVVLDTYTGGVLGLVGGSNFYDQKMGWNNAIHGGRQVGSCFKPFFYSAAFERGFSPSDMIVDQWVEYSTFAGPYRPVNYHKKTVYGPTTLIEALQHSRNIVTIRLYEALGMKKALELVHRFDYTDERKHWDIPVELSSCLGTIDCSPLQMAAAYQVFANLGVGIRPQFFRNAVDARGRVKVPIKRREEQIIDPVAAHQTQYLLRQVVKSGTGRFSIGNKFDSPPYPPICGKTGTTNDCRDAWFCGFTPELVIVVQVGFDPPLPMGPKMTGGKVAGEIWAKLFEEIIATREDWTMNFDQPDGIETANVCGQTGKRVSDVCGYSNHDTYRAVPFARGKAPVARCDGNAIVPLIQPVGPHYPYWEGRSPVRGFARWPGEFFWEEDEGGEFDREDDRQAIVF